MAADSIRTPTPGATSRRVAYHPANIVRRPFTITLVLLLTLFSAASARAAKYATIVGGSSTHPGERPGFRKNFDTLNRALLARGWETHVLFADGDAKLPAKEATNALIQAAVDDLAKRAQAGDQVLYFFCGHGSPRAERRGRGRAPEVTHSLQTQNGGFYSFDDLRDDLKTLSSKKVRTAVVDLTCFSGSTQVPDFTSRACVITLAATRYVSQCGTYDRTGIFTQKFVKLPDPDRQADVSLFDQFLAARVADPESANFAQISCVAAPAAAAWQTLWHDTDPANERRADSFDGRPVNPTRAARTAVAVTGNRVAISDAYAKIVAEAAPPQPKEQFQKLVTELEAKLDAYLQTQSELDAVCTDVRTKLSERMNWGFTGASARYNRQGFVDMREMIRKAGSGLTVEKYAGRGSGARGLYAAVVKDSARLAKLLDDLMKEIGDAWPRYEKLSATLNERGEAVMKVERQLYDLYARGLPANGSDPCRAFKF
jgi:hypothetical protein